jgi:uncharacterized protein (TIGR02466 family)
MNKRGVHKFFPVAVQTSEIGDAAKLNKSIIGEITKIRGTVPNSLPEAWSCNLYTTISSGINLLDQPAFASLQQHILTEAAAFAEVYGLDFASYPPRITECWVNVYGQGDSQEAHNHANSVISGIYYVAAPEGCGELLFHAPMSDTMLEPPTTGPNNVNTPLVALQPQAGEMVLFRSWLRHSVKPTRGKEERISIAFNLTM